jgi:exosortase/archaeosortase family protein
VLPLLEAALSYPMRRLSALLAAGLLSLAPGETHLAGTELSWGGLKVSVTSACSGLTLLQNVLWVAWWTVLLRHRGFAQRAVHALLAVPAVLIANTLRVLALAVGAAWYGEQILVGTPHVVIGWAAVALATLLFLAMEQLFPASAGADDGMS